MATHGSIGNAKALGIPNSIGIPQPNRMIDKYSVAGKNTAKLAQEALEGQTFYMQFSEVYPDNIVTRVQEMMDLDFNDPTSFNIQAQYPAQNLTRPLLEIEGNGYPGTSRTYDRVNKAVNATQNLNLVGQ